MSTAVDRRGELLAIAADLFAERGLRATTVREIADAAGILSGSLYHHFDSKESMVDEILREFLDELFDTYRAIAAEGLDPRATLERLVGASFDAIERRPAAVAIYQSESRRLAEQPRFTYVNDRWAEFRRLWLKVLRAGVADGSLRADLDVQLAYRFLRDTVWAGVGWFRRGTGADAAAAQYLSIVLDGIAAPRAQARPRRS